MGLGAIMLGMSAISNELALANLPARDCENFHNLFFKKRLTFSKIVIYYNCSKGQGIHHSEAQRAEYVICSKSYKRANLRVDVLSPT